MDSLFFHRIVTISPSRTSLVSKDISTIAYIFAPISRNLFFLTAVFLDRGLVNEINNFLVILCFTHLRDKRFFVFMERTNLRGNHIILRRFDTHLCHRYFVFLHTIIIITGLSFRSLLSYLSVRYNPLRCILMLLNLCNSRW